MEQTSFNLLILNLMIGLFKEHRYYRPLSTKVRILGYTAKGGIERKFLMGRRETTPEIMAYSEIQGHTILVESTYKARMNSKADQLRNYLNVTQSDLSGNAGLPSSACRENTTWVIVRPTSVDDYSKILDWKTDNGVVLSSFSEGPAAGFRLTQHGGAFRDSEFDSLVVPQIDFSRIYQGYVTIPTDDLNAEHLVKPAMQLLGSYIVRKRLQFHVEDIAKGLIPSWRDFGVEERVGIVTGLDHLFSRLKRRPDIENMLQRVEDANREWRIVYPEDKPASVGQMKLLRVLAKFQTELIGGQLGLDLDD